jgi:DNA-binding XRE family transcriptional regulator
MKQQKMSDEQRVFLSFMGFLIKELRRRKKLSYEKMAEEIGIARNTYYLLENGEINFQFTTLQLVLKYHKLPISTFFRDVEAGVELLQNKS